MNYFKLNDGKMDVLVIGSSMLLSRIPKTVVNVMTILLQSLKSGVWV